MGQISHLWHINTMENYVAIKKNEKVLYIVMERFEF